MDVKNLKRHVKALERSIESERWSKRVPVGPQIAPAWKYQNKAASTRCWYCSLETDELDNLENWVLTLVQHQPWSADCIHSTNQFAQGSVLRTWIKHLVIYGCTKEHDATLSVWAQRGPRWPVWRKWSFQTQSHCCPQKPPWQCQKSLPMTPLHYILLHTSVWSQDGGRTLPLCKSLAHLRKRFQPSACSAPCLPFGSGSGLRGPSNSPCQFQFADWYVLIFHLYTFIFVFSHTQVTSK